MRRARLLHAFLYASFLLLSSSFLLFAIFEVSSGLREAVRLEWIRDYALRDRLVPDPVLVFVPSRRSFTRESETRGDAYSSKFGIEVAPIRFVSSYREDGFRSNSSTPPYDLLVIGDSYVEVGETDADTLSERLKQTTGLATYNLGRPWYGPHQYVELLRRYAPVTKPKLALFCFFDGNDLRDLHEYEIWARGGDYYDFALARKGFLARYGAALLDTGHTIERWIRYHRYRLLHAASRWEGSIHPDLGLFAIGPRMLPMRIVYRPARQSADELLQSQGWKILRRLLSEFRATSLQYGIAPVLVFLPTKFQIYASHATPGSGARFRELLDGWGGFRSSSREAFARLAQELELPLIDVTPEFEARADRGELLYYPFDTHWNSAGRQAAAEYIATQLPAGSGRRRGGASAG
jgi:hypothetical protein